MPRSFYEILGVDPAATDEELLIALMRIEQRLENATDPESQEELRLAREAFAILSSRRRKPVGTLPTRNKLPTPNRRKTVSTLFAHDHPSVRLDDAAFAPPMRPPANTYLDMLRQPAFLAFLIALLGLLTYWHLETRKIKALETQHAVNETSLAEALAAKSKELAAKEEDLQQAQQALDDKQLELESRRIGVGEQAVGAYRDTRMRAIEAQEDIANRSLDIAKPKVDAEANVLNAQSNMVREQTRIVSVQATRAEQAYKNEVANEGYAIRAQKALLDSYEQQRLNGGDGISRSNPGLGR